MNISNSTITKGFIASGLMNLSVLGFSKFFTNESIPEVDPEVMSNFGLLMIAIWGLAYISVARSFHQVKWLVGVFAVEKFIYGFVWTRWMMNHSVSNVFEQDTMAGLFYSTYGINDWLFCIFYTLVFIKLHRNSNE